MNTKNNNHSRAFSLIEISVVLVIISIAIGSVFNFFEAGAKNNEYISTKIKMKKIMNAIDAFGVIYKRLPCPSNISLPKSAAGYGQEYCYGYKSTTNGVIAGGIPVNALLLDDDFAYDEWGSRIIYVTGRSISGSAGSTSYGAPPTGSAGYLFNDSASGLPTVSNTDGQVITNRAAIVLISPGIDQAGYFMQDGSSAPMTDEGAQTVANALGSGWQGVHYYVQTYSGDTNFGSSIDDIVMYQQKEQVAGAFGDRVKQINSSCKIAKNVFYGDVSSSLWSGEKICSNGSVQCMETVYRMARLVIDRCID